MDPLSTPPVKVNVGAQNSARPQEFPAGEQAVAERCLLNYERAPGAQSTELPEIALREGFEPPTTRVGGEVSETYATGRNCTTSTADNTSFGERNYPTENPHFAGEHARKVRTRRLCLWNLVHRDYAPAP